MLQCNSEQCPSLWCSVLEMAISTTRTGLRLDTFIKKANGTVRMERVMDRVQKFSGR